MLDLETLFFSSIVSRTAYLALFLVLALRQREAYLWHWSGAILASLLSSLIMFRSPTHQELDAWINAQVYTLYMASFALSWSGLRHFYERHVSAPIVVALILLPSLPWLLNPWAPVSTASQAMAFFMAAAFGAAMGVFEIVRPRGERLWSQVLVALALAGYGASLLVAACLLQLRPGKVSADMAYLSMIFDQATSILLYVGCIAMNGERANLKLRQQADTDPLTGLFNRRGIKRALHEKVFPKPGSAPMSVVIGDLDHFKRINDSLGHEGGDVVLKAFTECLKSTLRRDDLAVRWGGEEFLVVLPDTDIEAAEIFAERLRALTETHSFQVCGEPLGVTISIGVAEVDPHADTINKAIQRADKALYRAKREGRNRVCC